MKCVLVVDDDIETRDTIAALLEDEGYAVRVASDGASALAQLASGEVGLALVDLLMPRMNGWTLLEELSAQRKLGDVPIVVLTALSRISLPVPVPVLRKPFELEALLELVKRMFVDVPEENEDDPFRTGSDSSHQAGPPDRRHSQRNSGVYPLGVAKCLEEAAPEPRMRVPARRS